MAHLNIEIALGRQAGTKSAFFYRPAEQSKPFVLESRDVAVPHVDGLTSGLVAGKTIHLTGQLAYSEAHGGILPESNAAQQTELVLDRLERLLASQAMTLLDRGTSWLDRGTG